MFNGSLESFINFCDSNENIVNEGIATRILNNDRYKAHDKSITLYHGTYKEFPVIKANSVNMGNRLEGKNLSSFWVDNIEYAYLWSLNQVFEDLSVALDMDVKHGEYIKNVHDVDRLKFITPFPTNLKNPDGSGWIDMVSYFIDKHKGYIAKATIPLKYVNRGQLAINEYTVNKDVIPNEWITFQWKDVKDRIEFVGYDDFLEILNTYGYDIVSSITNKQKMIFRDKDEVLKKRGKNYSYYKKILSIKKRIFNNSEIQG